MKILFVENHPVFARLTAKRLLSSHLVRIVPSVSLALKSLETEHFDVILIDYDLDDGKGTDLILKLPDMVNRPKIIAVSSHAEGNAALIEAGANAVCCKQDFQKIESVISTISD